jgi:hypothetical protein
VLAPKTDEVELVDEEQTPAVKDDSTNSSDDDDDYDYDTNGIVDVAVDKGFKFHLKKRSECHFKQHKTDTIIRI